MEDRRNQLQPKPEPNSGTLFEKVLQKLEEFKQEQEAQGVYLKPFERSVWVVTNPEDTLKLFMEIQKREGVELNWHFATIINLNDFGQVIFHNHELIPIGDPQVFHNGEFNVLTKDIHDYARSRTEGTGNQV